MRCYRDTPTISLPSFLSHSFSCYQVFREAAHDTKGLLASGPQSIVLAFRGTATRKAALVDLQACPLPRTPSRHRPPTPRFLP